jgi:uncharacterized protein (DUF169 family)
MDNETRVTLLQCLLGLKQKPVGVKFIFKHEEFAALEVEQVTHKVSYCNMVRLASIGRSLKANADGFGCISAGRALGIIENNNFVASGRHYARHGLYDSRCTAKSVQSDVTFVRHQAYGVIVRPLQDFADDPDVVIVIANPYQVMRLIQGYAYHFGAKKDIKMTGMQAVCSECTAIPYENNDLNVSVMCSGTRFLCNWDDSVLGVGLPYNKFDLIVDGVVKTMNASDPDSKRKIIIDRLRQTGLHLEVILGKNYYTGLTGNICDPEYLAKDRK